MAEIPYDAIDVEQVRGEPLFFYLLASASFIEITSDLYTRNLLAFFRDDGEIATWLEQEWEKEELQHGAALWHYVQTAWPEFDWDAAYRNFFAEYRAYCTVTDLAPTQALEMVARCVVETGTASFYRMLSEASPEPVLKQLAAAISADEVRHYKHFYCYFMRCREREKPGRTAILRTLLSRIGEIDAEDAFYAFKHIYLARNPGAPFRRSDYTAVRAKLRDLARSHFPHRMATKMLLKPLNLQAPLGRVVLPAVTAAARLLCRL